VLDASAAGIAKSDYDEIRDLAVAVQGPTGNSENLHVIRQRVSACWHLARSSRLFLGSLTALPLLVVMAFAGVPSWSVILASHAVCSAWSSPRFS
jgi:hypothetical protein